MKPYLALVVFLGLATPCLASDIREGAVMHVKPHAIWFEEAEKLAQWQQLKAKGDAAAFTSYQEQALSERDAWQFINAQSVRILGYNGNTHQVSVEMTGEGRLQGSHWVVDAEAVEQ